MNSKKNSYISLSLAALIFPITYMGTKIIGYILKSWNPSGVNVESELAYLAHIIYFGIGVFAILAAASLVFAIKSLRESSKNGSKKTLAYLSIALVAVEVIVFVALFATR